MMASARTPCQQDSPCLHVQRLSTTSGAVPPSTVWLMSVQRKRPQCADVEFQVQELWLARSPLVLQASCVCEQLNIDLLSWILYLYVVHCRI
jgi:hypothetical protein